MEKYRFIDHTADVAFEVFGRFPEELFKNATEAFAYAFVSVDKINKDTKREIQVTGENLEDLLYAWLNELVYYFDAEFFVPLEVEKINIEKIEQSDGKTILRLKSNVVGGRITPDVVDVAPKAITLHDFKVEQVDDRFRAHVLIDI
jgi:SHS2 domain-containing protein